jgi:molybdopterin-guanine dinucleotide biosynthesis protein A
VDFDAIVLAGGTARRLDGADKPMLEVDGDPMLVRVLDAVGGARTRVVVGPRRPIDRDVIWCRERPSGSGPVAGLAAGLPLTRADVVVVLAADLPWIAAAVAPLVGALRPPTGAALLTGNRGPNYLAAAWRRPALTGALARLADVRGAAMRTLVVGVTVAEVTDQGWGHDCDTWADLARARGGRPDGSLR